MYWTFFKSKYNLVLENQPQKLKIEQFLFLLLKKPKGNARHKLKTQFHFSLHSKSKILSYKRKC